MNFKGKAIRWLIEEVGDKRFGTIYYHEDGSFISDAWEAMSFEKEQGAEKYINDNKKIFSVHKVKSIEHMFLN